MMLLISKISMTIIETLSFFIMYQFCIIKKKDSKPMLGVFFSLIFILNFILDKSQLSHTIIFYALFIVLINGLLKYSVKFSASFAVQAYLITQLSMLFTAINFLFWSSRYLDVTQFWKTAHFIDPLLLLFVITILSMIIKILYTRIRKTVGVSRNLSAKVRMILLVTASVLILGTLWLFSFLAQNWKAIIAITNLRFILFLSYSMMTFFVGYLGYIQIHNLCFKQKFDKVEQMAGNDPLSGLMSRSAGMNFLRKSFNHSKISGERLTIAFVDINDLKVVNDKHGHHAGDLLIEKISEVIKTNIRDTDAAMRFGGDEFIIVLPDCPQYRAEQIMTQINIYLKRFNLSGDFGYNLGISHGLVEYNPLRHNSALDLIAEADTEMYKNKKTKNKPSNK